MEEITQQTQAEPVINEPIQADSVPQNNPELVEFMPKTEPEPTGDQPEQPQDQKEESANVEKPEWLPGDFKTPEDLVKSYKEQQAEFTRRSQELAELKKETESYRAKEINNTISNADNVLRNDLQIIDLALKEGRLTQSQYEFEKGQVFEAYKGYVEQLKGLKPQTQQEAEPHQGQNIEAEVKQAYIEKYGEPVSIDDFTAKETEFLNQPYKQEIFNNLKNLYGGQLGSKELSAIKGMVEMIEKGTEARLRAELSAQNQELDMKSRMSSAVNSMPQAGGGEKIWTRADIARLTNEEILKYDEEIQSQIAKGLVK